MSRPLPNPPTYSYSMPPVPFNLGPVTASRTFKPSKLAPPPPAPPTTSDTPSSPTTSSFYLASDRSRSSSRPPLGRTHKSHSSARHRPAGSSSAQRPTASSSSPTSLSNVHQNARLANSRASRPPKATTRDLSLGEASNPFEEGVYGAGGMRNGEWEEWTKEEVLGLELEGRKAKREWRARYAAGAPSSEGDLEEEPELDEVDGRSWHCQKTERCS